MLDSKYIGLNGDECDKAGVSYEAFYNQPDRCEKPRSSCLQNQPAQLWRRDLVIKDIILNVSLDKFTTLLF